MRHQTTNIPSTDVGDLPSTPRSVEVLGSIESSKFKTYPIHSIKMTTFKGAVKGISGVPIILGNAPLLEECTILYNAKFCDSIEPSGMTTHLRLSSLVFEYADSDEDEDASTTTSFQPLFKHLCLPSLTSLSFIGHRNKVDLHGLDDLLRRSKCTLTKLTLHHISALQNDWKEILGYMKDLEELYLADRDCDVIDDILDWLSQTSSCLFLDECGWPLTRAASSHPGSASDSSTTTAAFLPLLKKLDIHVLYSHDDVAGCQWTSKSNDLLLKVLEPRVKERMGVMIYRPLKTLLVRRQIQYTDTPWPFLQEYALEEIRELRKEGREIDIRIEYVSDLDEAEPEPESDICTSKARRTTDFVADSLKNLCASAEMARGMRCHLLGCCLPRVEDEWYSRYDYDSLKEHYYVD